MNKVHEEFEEKIKFRVWDIENEVMVPWELLANSEISSFENPNFIFMPYIGLSDSDGTEIYRKDIIDYVGIHLHTVFGFPKVVEYTKSKSFIGYMIAQSKNLKVIGNVFQNPELRELLNEKTT